MLTFSENSEFSSTTVMTVINVNRSLTNCSIINSFLKAIVWMRLVATSGSFFVGDPSISGPPYHHGLLVTKKVLQMNKNKMMIRHHHTTQVASAGSFKEVSAPSLVLSLPTSTTNNTVPAGQKKKTIINGSSFFNEKINLLGDWLVEDLAYFANMTASSRHVVVALDTFALVRPFLPIYNKNTLDGGDWPFENEESEEEEFLPSITPSLPFAAETLDRVAAEVYLGLERFINWNCDTVLALFLNVQDWWSHDAAAFSECSAVVKEGTASILSSLNAKWKNFYEGWDLSWHDTCMPFHEHDVDPRTWPFTSSYTNSTISTHHYVVVALDTFALVRPFLPIYNKNTLDGGDWPFENEESEEEEFLPSTTTLSLPFAAETLDRVAAEVYLGLERFIHWNCDTVLALFLNVQDWWSHDAAAFSECSAVVKEGTASILSSLNAKWKNFYEGWDLSWHDTCMPFHEHDVDPRTWPFTSSYTNSTKSSHQVIVTLDTFALVRPFLPIYNKNTLDGGDWPFENEGKEEEEFLPSITPSLPFAAGTLDRVAAEVYLGLERFINWNCEKFLILFLNVQDWWSHHDSVTFSECSAAVKEGAASILSFLNAKWKNFHEGWGLSWQDTYMLSFIDDVGPRTLPGLMSCTNGTISTHHYVVTLDTFGLGSPFLSTYKNNSDCIWLLEDEKLLRHSPLPFAAGTLDKIAAELYLGAEWLVDWNYNTFLSFLMNAQDWCHSFVSTILSLVQEKLPNFSAERNPTWFYSSYYFRHRSIIKGLWPYFVCIIVFFAFAIGFFCCQLQWVLRIIFKCLGRLLGIMNSCRRWSRPRELPSCFHHDTQQQIVKLSSISSSYKIHHERLPFEIHDMCTEWSYDHQSVTLWLQEEYPDDEYMDARKIFRDAEFFENTKGFCAKRCGIFIETIMEEEEEEEDVIYEYEVLDGNSVGGEVLNGDVWCDALDEEEDDYAESTGEMTRSFTTPSDCDPVSQTAPDSKNNVQWDYCDNGVSVTTKTRQDDDEVVETFIIAPAIPPDKKETSNRNKDELLALGSGFYVDSMGRMRRFSYRLLVEKIV